MIHDEQYWLDTFTTLIERVLTGATGELTDGLLIDALAEFRSEYGRVDDCTACASRRFVRDVMPHGEPEMRAVCAVCRHEEMATP